MRKRGLAALLIVLAALATSGSAGPAPRRLGAPRHVSPECVRLLPGDVGNHWSPDGELVVHVLDWRFRDGSGVFHGVDYRTWTPHTAAFRAGRVWRPWRGFTSDTIVAIEICPTGPAVRPTVA